MSILSILGGTIFRRLPYTQANDLVLLKAASTSNGYTAISLADFDEWSGSARVLRQLSYFRLTKAFIVMPGDEPRVTQVSIGPHFFDVLMASPSLGRGFLATEYATGGDPVIISGDVKRFLIRNGLTNPLGQTIQIDGTKKVVVGIMPDRFRFPAADPSLQVWIPLVTQPADYRRPGTGAFTVVGRKVHELTTTQVQDELTMIQRRLVPYYADTMAKNLAPDAVSVETYRASLIDHLRPRIIVVTCITFLIWTIACANVAILLLARQVSRSSEVALRVALGANRKALIFNELTDNAVLAMASLLLGGALGWAVLKLSRHWLFSMLLPVAPYSLDWRVILALVLLCVSSICVFSIGPAFFGRDELLRHSLNVLASHSKGSVHLHKMQATLIASEVCLSVATLIACAFAYCAVRNLQAIPLGFDPNGLLVIRFNSPTAETDHLDLLQHLYRPLLQRVELLPGIESAALTTAVPLSTDFSVTVHVGIGSGTRTDKTTRIVDAKLVAASPKLMNTLRLKLVTGRFFTSSDRVDTKPVIVVNAAFQRAYQSGGLSINNFAVDVGDNRRAAIVGVVADFRQDGLDVPATPEILIDEAQMRSDDYYYGILAGKQMQLVFRTGNQTQLSPADISASLRHWSPELRASEVTTMENIINSGISDQLQLRALLIAVSSLALIFGVAGLYVFLHYAMALRSSELAVRVALGARMRHVYTLTLRSAGKMLIAGCMAGSMLGFWASRLLGSAIGSAGIPLGLLIVASASVVLSFGLLSASLATWRAMPRCPSELLKGT